MKEIIIYLRKSRSDGEATIQEVLAKHEGILQEYAVNEYGAPIREKNIYREVVSGETIADRPMMQQLLDRLEVEEISGVLVVDPQRLTRGDLSDCGKIVNAFRYTKTAVITPQKTYDLADKFDRKFFEMELLRGNDYLEYTKEILNRGRIASVKKGHFIGSQAPYGYKRIFLDPEHRRSPTLEPEPTEAPAVRLAYDLFANKGYGFQRVAAALDAAGFPPRHKDHWSPSTLKDLLENPVYIGKVRWNWRKTEKIMEDGEIKKTRPKSDRSTWLLADGLHPALIDGDTYQKAVKRIGSVPCIRKSMRLHNPLAGLLYCRCGRAMAYKPDHATERFLCGDQRNCHTRSVQVSLVMERITKTLTTAIADFEIASQQDNSVEIEAHAAACKAIQKTLDDLNRREQEQYDLLEDGIYSREIFLRRHKSLLDERHKAVTALETLMQTAPVRTDYEEKIHRYREALHAIQTPDTEPELLNHLLKSVISRIDYATDQTTITNNRWLPPDFTLTINLIF